MRLGQLSVSLLTLALPLIGQNYTGLTCTANVEAPRNIDASAGTGLIGDVLITCGGGTPTPAGQPVPPAEFVISVNPKINITSPFLGLPGFNTHTDALLFVNNPTPDNQVLCLPHGTVPDTCPGSYIGSGDGAGTYDPRVERGGQRVGNAWTGTWAPTRDIRFRAPLDPPGVGKTTVFRITGVRVNAAQLEVQSEEQEDLEAEIRMAFDAGLQKIFQSRLPGAARVGNEFNFHLQTPRTLYQCEAANPNLPVNPDLVDEFRVITTNFAEEFGRNQGAIVNIKTPSGTNEFHGNLYAFQGFSRRRSLPNWPVDTGVPANDPLLTLQFDNIPSGVGLWAERNVTNGATTAVLFSTDPSTGRFVQIPIIDGRADIGWRITQASGRESDSVSPKIAISYGANQPALGTASVKGRLGPLHRFPFGGNRFFRDYAEDRAKAGTAALTILPCPSNTTIPPQLAVTTGFFPVNYRQQGNPVGEGKLYLLAGGAPRKVSVEISQATWLAVAANSDTMPVTIDLGINPNPPGNNFRAAALAPGNYTGTFRILVEGLPPATITVPLVVSPPGPHLTRWGVANTASYETEAIAPGEVLTLFGERFGPDTLAPAQIVDGKFTTSLAGTRVLFDGVAAPLIYAVRGQVSVIAPFGLAGKSGTRIQIEYQGVLSPAVSVPVVAAVPALLTADASGSGKAAALNQDYSYNSVTGALPGEYVAFYGVGGPATDVAGRDGELYQAPLPKFTGTIKVFLDGVEVPASDVAYAGPAPGLVQGVWQANVLIPATARRNSQIQIEFQFGDFKTQPGVTVSVR